MQVRSAEFAEGDEPPKEKTPNPKRRTKKPSVEARFDLPPQDAIDYFEAKKIVRKSEFNRLSKEARQGAFSVSGVYNDDVLRGFKNELDLALKEGRTQQQTIKRFKDILSGAGHRELGEYHLETIFRANMGTAHGVGRRQAMEAITDVMPFWEYRGARDDRERPTHWTFEGIILPASHPFWNTHYGPWEFGCRCGALPTDSIPDDYDPKNPSGELDEYGEPLVQISYDDEGTPVKAEVGTSLIDLSVTSNFSGVPPGASLLSAIEAGVERAESARKK